MYVCYTMNINSREISTVHGPHVQRHFQTYGNGGKLRERSHRLGNSCSLSVLRKTRITQDLLRSSWIEDVLYSLDLAPCEFHVFHSAALLLTFQ